MNRKGFLATLIIAPIAALFAKKAEAAPPPAVSVDPPQPSSLWSTPGSSIFGRVWGDGKEHAAFTLICGASGVCNCPICENRRKLFNGGVVWRVVSLQPGISESDLFVDSPDYVEVKQR